MDAYTSLSNHDWVSAADSIHGMQKPTTREVVIANIRALMAASGDSEHGLSKKAGMRQSTLHNMLSGRHAISIERAEMVAKVYGLEGWHLLLRNLPRDLRESKTIAALVENYLASSSESREHITRVAEREAKYSAD